MKRSRKMFENAAIPTADTVIIKKSFVH